MFASLSFLAQTSAEFLKKNRELSQLLANSFDQVWDDTINSDLFIRICAMGAAFGLLALSVFAYQWIEYQMGQRGYLDWSTIIIPLFLVILLAKPTGKVPILKNLNHKNPPLIGRVLLGARNMGNDLSAELLNDLSQNLTASQASDVAAGKTMIQLIAADAVKTCAEITEKQVRDDCFLAAEQQIIKLVNQYRPIGMNPITNVLNLVKENWATKLGRESIEKIKDAQGTSYATSRWFGRLFGGFGATFQATSNSFGMPIFFLSMGYAFYWVLELIALLTALTNPLFLGMSLYSFRHEPFVRSLSMFLGVWLARFSYAIIIGFTGLLMSNPDLTAPVLLFPLIAGFFGPILALIMGAGGGLGMLSVFSGAALFSFGNSR